MKIHDIHIHTTLSRCCSDPNATPENYLRLGQSRGMTVMGISNHFWDSDVPGSSDWYRVQNFDHISQVKYAFPYEQLNRMGIRLLFGCETEYAQGVLGIDPAKARLFDYLLIPHTHTHMKDFVIPKSVADPDDLAAFMTRTYREVVQIRLDAPTSIAHPFIACGYSPEMQMELVERISDADFRESFSIAAQNGVGLELNASTLHLQPGRQDFQGHPLTRMYLLAKECGVKFTMGSDAHSPDSWDRIDLEPLFWQACGITKADFMDFVR